jgi:hypothetical protein
LAAPVPQLRTNQTNNLAAQITDCHYPHSNLQTLFIASPHIAQPLFSKSVPTFVATLAVHPRLTFPC